MRKSASALAVASSLAVDRSRGTPIAARLPRGSSARRSLPEAAWARGAAADDSDEMVGPRDMVPGLNVGCSDPSADSSLDTAVGRGGYADVITAQNIALSARTAQIQADVNRQIAAITLIEAIGGHWNT